MCLCNASNVSQQIYTHEKTEDVLRTKWWRSIFSSLSPCTLCLSHIFGQSTLSQVWFFFFSSYHVTCHQCNTKTLIYFCLSSLTCIQCTCSLQQWKWSQYLSQTEKHYSLQITVSQSKMWRWHIHMSDPLSSCHFAILCWSVPNCPHTQSHVNQIQFQAAA